MSKNTAEADRMRAENADREARLPANFYGLDKPANLFLRQSQERVTLALLHHSGMLPLAGRRILEVGCGTGAWLQTFRHFGADPAALAGIDVDEGRIAKARALLPQADIRAGDAAQLPWPDGHFDVIAQYTVFTSVLDGPTRFAIAAQMRRVLKPGGVIIWYDFTYDNPRNKAVRGITVREVSRLFPNCALDVRRVTLAPFLARLLVPLSWTLASLLEEVRVLNTHVAVSIRP
ncbi:MAG: class I SAM-dependent methyltransferase [Myxococcaceae bacterium]|nr:class I SAM-dependent methyltransferase [Myxococcaceae bacterium]